MKVRSSLRRASGLRKYYVLFVLIGVFGLFPFAFGEEAPVAAPPSPTTEAKPAETPAAVPAVAPEVRPIFEVGKIEKGTVLFATGASNARPNDLPPPLKTSYFGLESLGRLDPPQGGVPYLVLVGMPCQGCNDKKELLLIKADGSRQEKFVYPGKVKDRKNGALLYEGRSFYGDCLSNRGPVYVAFQSDKMDRKRFPQPSVFVAELQEDGTLVEKLIMRRRPPIAATLKRVKKKECFEVSGVDRISGEFPVIGPARRTSENN